jgi:predicted nucleic acid-binding protein
VLAELLVSFETSDSVSVNAALNAITGALSTIYDLTKEVAISAAEIRSNNKITLGDAIVIATAIEDKANLLTFDKNMKAVYERIK